MKNIMKTITWVLLLQLYIFGISCNESILSKFHQNSFKIRDVRMVLKRYNVSYFSFLEIKTYKYNRTTPAINLTFTMKINVKDKTEVVVQVKKFLSNEYRHFPIRFQANLQTAFEANALGIQRITDCGNMTNFYFQKDISYHFCNFVLDETHFPPLIPSGIFRIDLQMMHLHDEMSLLYVYLEVYTPIAYPKK